MPDFERLTRRLEIDLARNGLQRKLIKERHSGEDRARKEIALIAGLVISVALVLVLVAK